jgi:hypothetical protein
MRAPTIALAVAMLAAGCVEEREVTACATFPLRGVDAALRTAPFATYGHRREIHYDAISNSSRLLVGDSTYEYSVLLTYVFAHPGLTRGGDPDARCVREASLLVQLPLDEGRTRALDAFLAMLRGSGAAAEVLSRVESARKDGLAVAGVGTLGQAPVLAGVVEHDARGRFFRVEVRSPS